MIKTKIQSGLYFFNKLLRWLEVFLDLSHINILAGHPSHIWMSKVIYDRLLRNYSRWSFSSKSEGNAITCTFHFSATRYDLGGVNYPSWKAEIWWYTFIGCESISGTDNVCSNSPITESAKNHADAFAMVVRDPIYRQPGVLRSL